MGGEKGVPSEGRLPRIKDYMEIKHVAAFFDYYGTQDKVTKNCRGFSAALPMNRQTVSHESLPTDVFKSLTPLTLSEVHIPVAGVRHCKEQSQPLSPSLTKRSSAIGRPI